MARIKYYYDTEKCKFERARPSFQSVLRRVAMHATVAGAVGAAIFAFRYHLIDNAKEKSLKQEKRELMAHIQNFGTEIATLEQEVEKLHEVDIQVYRTILDAEPLSDAVWQAGTGGSDKEDLKPELVGETRDRLDKMESKIKVQFQSYNSLLKKFKEKEEELKHTPSILPVEADVISGFGMRMHPILRFQRLHAGLDFRAPIGTKVFATADGVVEFAGVKKNGYGIHVDISHGFGFSTKYAHLSEVKVREGQKVKRGDVIGMTGNTGLSKGPHLHYEIIKGGKKINPIDYFYSDLDPEKYVKYKKQAQQENESMD